ncbi:hypothetical protein T05_6337 [Trichinella murrelli]|uniref:Transmembrane protein n=1 Tax=Trichinella murrelli TaxID=144512 RepID=A0A0V0TQB0_9BILA|nr:hypothetical protein T05_6337 [Trichinella murrelli]
MMIIYSYLACCLLSLSSFIRNFSIRSTCCVFKIRFMDGWMDDRFLLPYWLRGKKFFFFVPLANCVALFIFYFFSLCSLFRAGKQSQHFRPLLSFSLKSIIA